MNIKEWLRIHYPGESLLTMDGLDEAFIGVATCFGQDLKTVYDRKKILQIFIENGMTYEEAQEYISFNVEGSYMGEKTPLIIDIKE
jgi:hypothetical protein